MFENYRLKKVTYNLGEIIEKPNYILCDVNPEKLKKLSKDGYLYLETKDLKSKYGINKSIIFNIDNYFFEEGIHLLTDSTINFNNCVFKDNIYVENAKNIVFNNNTYINESDEYKDSDRFMDINVYNKVIFINEKISNYNNDLDTSIKVSANNINIINSTISNDDISNANLQCNRLQLINSSIEGYSTFIKSPSIIIDRVSRITPNRSIIIDTNTELNTNDLSSDQIIINGLKIFKNKNKVLKKQ